MIRAGKIYQITKIVNNSMAARFMAEVTSVEDCGDHWYIGYKPTDFAKACRWGFLKIKKEGRYKAINYSIVEK